MCDYCWFCCDMAEARQHCSDLPPIKKIIQKKKILEKNKQSSTIAGHICSHAPHSCTGQGCQRGFMAVSLQSSIEAFQALLSRCCSYASVTDVG